MHETLFKKIKVVNTAMKMIVKIRCSNKIDSSMVWRNKMLWMPHNKKYFNNQIKSTRVWFEQICFLKLTLLFNIYFKKVIFAFTYPLSTYYSNNVTVSMFSRSLEAVYLIL